MELILGKFVDWSLRNKLWVLLFTVILILFSIYKLPELSVDAVPDVTNVQVMVNAKTKGLDPGKVELTVTQPMEFEFMGLPKLKDMRSISKYGLSQVILVFEEGTDIYWARQQVTEKLQILSGSLGDGISPELAPITTGLGEVFMYTLLLDQKSPYFNKTNEEKLQYLREIQDYEVRPALRRIKDVADVDTGGGFKKEMHINLNPQKLISYGLTIDNIAQKLKGIGETFGGGTINLDKQSLIVRSSSMLNSPTDLELINLGVRYDGKKILLKDVAEIRFDSAPRVGGASFNGQETILGTVLMQNGGNGRQVSLSSAKVLMDLKLPTGVTPKILYNRSFLVNNTLHTVTKNLIEGAVLVIIILLLILGHARAALLVSLIIPLSMLGTTIGMQGLHISGNLMSLGAIDFGLVVDGAVVLIENLISKMQSLTPDEKKNLSLDHVVSESSKEVIKPVVFGLLMIMLVYIPILTLEGIEGKMFRPMAYTVLMTLAWALLFTLFLMPVLASLFLKHSETTKESSSEHETKFFGFVKKVYQPIFERSFTHPKILMVAGILLIFVSSLVFTKLGSDFIPQLDEGDIVLNVTRDAKISLTQALIEQAELEKRILTIPEIELVFARLGTPESATDPMGVHLSDTFIILKKDRSQWRFKTKDGIYNEIKKQIETLPTKQELSSTQPIEMRFNEMLEGSRADVSLRIIGPDLKYMVKEIDHLQSLVSDVKGLDSAEMDPLTALRESEVIDITPNFVELARLGIGLDDFNKTIVSFMHGMVAGYWIQGVKKYNILVHLDESKREVIDEINHLPIALTNGGSVPLEKVASIHKLSQVTTIARSFAKRYAALSLNIAGRDTMSFVDDIKKKVGTISLDKGHELQINGQFKNLEEAKKKLWIIIPLTLIIIFFILWRQFASVFDAVIIFSSIPFACVGGIFALWIRDIHVSLSAAVGFIALIGIALLNGIVLITVFRQVREVNPSLSWDQVIRKGTFSRLRPVIMTALVASLGFIPMAVNTGLGSEVQRPLATVVIGGILFSTILTLILIPSIYLHFINRSELKHK